MSEIQPHPDYRPYPGAEHVPRCDFRCPAHRWRGVTAHKCGLLGGREVDVCEPAIEAMAKALASIRESLDHEGCACTCLHDAEGHLPTCEPCLACRITITLGGTDGR